MGDTSQELPSIEEIIRAWWGNGPTHGAGGIESIWTKEAERVRGLFVTLLAARDFEIAGLREELHATQARVLKYEVDAQARNGTAEKALSGIHAATEKLVEAHTMLRKPAGSANADDDLAQWIRRREDLDRALDEFVAALQTLPETGGAP